MDAMAPTATGLSDALVAVGDRWSMLVIEALLGGAKRFGDLEEEIDGIAPNILSARLRKLTDHGLVAATAYSDRPPRFSYELTDAGRELEVPLRLLTAWAERHTRGRQAPHHDACGTPLAVAWYCPTCREVVADESGEDELQYA
jgi:DNA-binding HxlR family transcriptional regulator